MRRKLLFLLLFVIIITILYYSGILLNIVAYSHYIVSSDCNEAFTVSGENKNTVVYECDGMIMEELAWYTAYASVHGNKIVTHPSFSRNLLMHELGHNLGYLHSDKKSIMNHSSMYREHKDRELTEAAIKIANEYEGYKVINWSKDKDIKYINKEIRNNNISKTKTIYIRENINKYKENDCRGIYYEHTSWSNSIPDLSDFYITCGKVK